MNGCSEVCILVHNSEQDFKEEVVLLKKLWPGKIHLFYQEEFEFHQTAAVHAIRFLMQNQNYDWMYVFDADEFIVRDKDFNLCDFLEGVPSEIQSVRYEIKNWISNHDFELKQYEEFLDIVHISDPRLISPIDTNILKQKIKHNEANFFDLPFPSKIIFRANTPYYLSSGAHYLEGHPEDVEISLADKFFQVAHLPLLTKLRLALRVQHGENLMFSGYPEEHGWQERMLFELDRESGLNSFWNSHAIKTSERNLDTEKPFARVDFAFRNAIRPTVKVLNEFISSTPSTEVVVSKDTDISSLINFYKFIFKFNSKSNNAIVERDHAIVERDQIQKSSIWKFFSIYRLLKSKLISYR
jgi:hypothetical protein